MNKHISLFAVLGAAALLTSCRPSVEKDEFVTLDFTRSYPEKQLTVQDFMDVEYVALETNDEFITRGLLADISDHYIVMQNRVDEGDIFFFDRQTGRALWKFNRKGKGPGEYSSMMAVLLDEKRGELFVNDNGSRKIHVYDIHGEHKRSFSYPEKAQFIYMYNFDDDNLIFYNIDGLFSNGEKREGRTFQIVLSKDDGSVTDNIFIPFDLIRSPVIIHDGNPLVLILHVIDPYRDGVLISDTSSDTIYHYTQQRELKPYMAKSPDHADDFFLTTGVMTRDYSFMEVNKREYNQGQGFPQTTLLYDRKEQALYTPEVINADWPDGNKVSMFANVFNRDVTVVETLDAADLVEALDEGKLQGSLLEIATRLTEDDNPVLMIMKEKK